MGLCLDLGCSSESTTSLVISPAHSWYLQLTLRVATAFCFLTLNGVQLNGCSALRAAARCSDGGRFCFQPEGCVDTSGSLESKAPYFSHLILAELGRWHGVSTAGKLYRLGERFAWKALSAS